MNKELEALDKLKKCIGMKDDFDNEAKSYYAIVKQSLTPPTSEQVCELLTKHYLGFKVIYKDKMFKFAKFEVNDGDNYICHLGINGITLYQMLPVDIVEAIVKFYKGVLENDTK